MAGKYFTLSLMQYGLKEPYAHVEEIIQIGIVLCYNRFQIELK